jgi:hypothetical protein
MRARPGDRSGRELDRGTTLATMTDAAIQWLGTRASFLTPRELLGEALRLRGFHARVESGRLRVILDHPSDRSVLQPFLDLGADGRVLCPFPPFLPLEFRDDDPGANGLDQNDPWHMSAWSVVAIDREERALGGTTEESWRQFRSRARCRPPPVATDVDCLDVGVALLVRVLSLLDCKTIHSCDGHHRDSGREVVRDAQLEFASPWDAILAASLVTMAGGGSPREWQWSYRSLRVPHAGGHDTRGLVRMLADVQRVAHALVDHPRWGVLRRARVSALGEYGRIEPHPEEFRAGLRRRLDPQAVGTELAQLGGS